MVKCLIKICTLFEEQKKRENKKHKENSKEKAVSKEENFFNYMFGMETIALAQLEHVERHR